MTTLSTVEPNGEVDTDPVVSSLATSSHVFLALDSVLIILSPDCQVRIFSQSESFFKVTRFFIGSCVPEFLALDSVLNILSPDYQVEFSAKQNPSSR